MKENAMKRWTFAALLALLPLSSRAESSFMMGDGISRAPGTVVLVPNGNGVAAPPSVSNPLVVGAVPQSVTFSSCGGTIAATNVPQLMVAANSSRHYLVVDNPTVDAMEVGLNSGVTAATGLPVFAGGGGYEWASVTPTNTIYIMGNAGDSYVCWQG